MFKNVTIIGDGAMGTVCAMLLCSNGINVKMWGHSKQQLDKFDAARENTLFLPGYKLPENLTFDANDETAMADAQMIVSAIPCQFARNIWQRLKPNVPYGVPILSITKGLEIATLERPSEIISKTIDDGRTVGVLSGPNIADELVRGLPGSACVVSSDNDFAHEAQQSFNTSTFRVYTNDDVIGVELAGAMKNVIAIAAGIIDGKKLGDNAKAALLARGLREISRLGEALGAKSQTFSGLTGLGDLVTTCISPMGRNRSFGELIGKGVAARDALSATNSVVEGEATCRAVYKLAKELNVDMPITQAVYRIVTSELTVEQALEQLMQRGLKAE